jgi:hypothetical protein
MRDQILERLLRVVALVGAVAYIPSCYLSLSDGLWPLAAFDSLAFAVLLAAAFIRRLGYRARLAILVGSAVLISGAVLFATGPFGAGYIYLICAVFLAALLGNNRLIVATIASSAAIACGYALFLVFGHPRLGQSLASFLIVASNLVLVCAVLGMAARRLITGLESANAEEKRLSLRVGEELAAARGAEAALATEMAAKEELLRELNHRVRNNMQLMLSLLTIENSRQDADSMARLSRRIHSLSLANDMILSDPDAGSVDLQQLLLASLVDQHIFIGEGTPFKVEPFSFRLPVDSLIGFALAIGDIVGSLNAMGVPVDVALGGGGGKPSLVFGWPSSEEPGRPSPAAALRSDPFLLGLMKPGCLSFAPGQRGGRASLGLELGQEDGGPGLPEGARGAVS